MKHIKETGICAMCDGPYTHYGNNPEPIMKYYERVCDECNDLHVKLIRIKRMNNAKNP